MKPSQSTSPSSDGPRRAAPKAGGKLWVKLALTGVALVLSLGVVELVVRRTWAAAGHPFTPELARARMTGTSAFMREGEVGEIAKRSKHELGEAAQKARKKYSFKSFLHPYFGWDVDAPQREYEKQLSQFQGRQGERHLDVLILGGSVAASFPSCGKAELARVLAADERFADRPLRIHNHAVAAFKQPQQLTRLAYLFALGFAPDVVINLDGFNEVAVARHNSTVDLHPLYPAAAKWARWLEPDATFDAMAELRGQQLAAQRALGWLLDRGADRLAITAELSIWWLDGIRERGLQAYGRVVQLSKGDGATPGATEAEGPSARRGPDFPLGAPLMELLVAAWANTSLAIQGLCDAHGAFYLHVLQPTLHDEGSKPLTQAEIDSSGCSKPWKMGAQQGYPMLRAAGAQLAREGVAFLDASGVFADHPGELYFDACHFVCEGHEILARAIGNELLARLPADGWPQPEGGIHQPFLGRD